MTDREKLLRRLLVLRLRRVLLIGIALFIGFAFYSLGLWLLSLLIHGNAPNNWWLKALLGMLSFILITLGMGFALIPFNEVEFINRFSKLLLTPFDIIMRFMRYYNYVAGPLFALVSVYTLSLLTWSGLNVLGVVPENTIRGAVYLGMVLSSVAFMYFGDKVTEVFLSVAGKSWDYSGLIRVLHPKLVRFYVYGLMIAAYTLANLERFSGHLIIQWGFWVQYREIVLEVLLTVGLIDGLILLWKDGKKT